jgi:hypothetical protein
MRELRAATRRFGKRFPTGSKIMTISASGKGPAWTAAVSGLRVCEGQEPDAAGDGHAAA